VTGPDPGTDEPARIIERLGLRRHPEGGWYAETWRARAAPGERPAGSAILFLLRAGEMSRWHRVDADEMWHHYAGAPIELRIAGPVTAPDAEPAAAPSTVVLGSDVLAGERPQAVVPAGAWQTARSLGAWTLVGCTVSPAFTFDGFELALDGWEPG
jgi:predicted cupin superfamily sugar epimerase